MLKKSVSAFLSIVMLFSILSVPSLAANRSFQRKESLFESGKLRETVNSAAARLVGEEERVSVSDALFDAVLETVGPKATEATIQKAMSGFVVLNISDFPEDVRRIAESAEFQIRKDNVVYIVIELDKNPEILDVITLCRVAQALCELQNDFIAESGKDSVKANTYIHIIGELALHCAVYSLTKAAGGDRGRSPLHSLYEHARETELNQTEARGFILIRIVGLILSEYYNSKA